jgi:hypothetical protein
MALLVLFGISHARKTDDAREMLTHTTTVPKGVLVSA